ncbi:MAG: hypothetical protein KGV59_02880 [Tenacibaculum sp.]|nr:hypothetical protein [Tenacibaculum sp.]
MKNIFLDSIAYTLPSLVTGVVAYYILGSITQNNSESKKIDAFISKKKVSLQMKLQAYERLLLFCERINPSKLLLRVQSIGEDTNSYLHLLVNTIEQEFEHNLTQQLYISEDAWATITASKLAVINKLHLIAENSENSKDFRDKILKEFYQTENPMQVAISVIKQDVNNIL